MVASGIDNAVSGDAFFTNILEGVDSPKGSMEEDDLSGDWDAKFQCLGPIPSEAIEGLFLVPQSNVRSHTCRMGPNSSLQVETTKLNVFEEISGASYHLDSSDGKESSIFQEHSPISVVESTSSIPLRSHRKRQSPVIFEPCLIRSKTSRVRKKTKNKILSWQSGELEIKESSCEHLVTTKKCANCHASKTPRWRRGPKGIQNLCNACGLQYKTNRLSRQCHPVASPILPSVHSSFEKPVIPMGNKVIQEEDTTAMDPAVSRQPEFIPISCYLSRYMEIKSIYSENPVGTEISRYREKTKPLHRSVGTTGAENNTSEMQCHTDRCFSAPSSAFCPAFHSNSREKVNKRTNKDLKEDALSGMDPAVLSPPEFVHLSNNVSLGMEKKGSYSQEPVAIPKCTRRKVETLGPGIHAFGVGSASLHSNLEKEAMQRTDKTTEEAMTEDATAMLSSPEFVPLISSSSRVTEIKESSFPQSNATKKCMHRERRRTAQSRNGSVRQICGACSAASLESVLSLHSSSQMKVIHDGHKAIKETMNEDNRAPPEFIPLSDRSLNAVVNEISLSKGSLHDVEIKEMSESNGSLHDVEIKEISSQPSVATEKRTHLKLTRTSQWREGTMRPSIYPCGVHSISSSALLPFKKVTKRRNKVIYGKPRAEVHSAMPSPPESALLSNNLSCDMESKESSCQRASAAIGSTHCGIRSPQCKQVKQNRSIIMVEEAITEMNHSILSPSEIGPMDSNAPREREEIQKIGVQPPLATKICTHCFVTKTPLWRTGPMGTKTLCNACGLRYKKGLLLTQYPPAASPTYGPFLHSSITGSYTDE
ncbi:hypothetical protein RJ639_042714 [Escallonia herrerae]|uniref:GATA-type domain-containing protein n=1 Tax=Escallonia herrerae TaxID=1293975 RepID=A0AA88WCL3_9ASTE|nr:hypothetical protein RJ639_042714 [Escallonia herrerae]